MPKRIFHIQFHREGSVFPVHRIRNLGEDFFREFQETGIGRVHAGLGHGEYDVDHATDVIIIEVKHTRMIGRVAKRINKLLAAHFFDGKVTITRE